MIYIKISRKILIKVKYESTEDTFWNFNNSRLSQNKRRLFTNYLTINSLCGNIICDLSNKKILTSLQNNNMNSAKIKLNIKYIAIYNKIKWS